MLTVTKLARQFNLSRTTILYYEKEELLIPASRSENGYRWYGSKEISQLESIINYRSFGISIQQIKQLLANNGEGKQQQTLRQQFNNLENEIQKLRQQQLAIVNFLEAPDLLDKNMTKEKWTQIMEMSGMDEQGMLNWHKEFEKLQPDAHQEFLESLQIDENEIMRIRKRSNE